MNKKTLTISVVILFIVALGLAYYYFFIMKNTVGTTSTGGTPSSTNFFPFGQGGGTTNQGQSGTSTTTVTANQPISTTNYLEKLRLISNEPVAGAAFVEGKTGVYIRYMEKATGHIYDVATFGPDAHEVSNTTIPDVHEAYFTEKGSSVIARYVGDDNETITTIYGKISSTTSGTLLPSGIDSFAVSPSGTNVFYIQKSSIGSTGIESAPNGSGKQQIWDSPIRSVLPQFAGENQILITTKPNAQALGYSYLVNAKTGGVKNLLQNLPDLSTFANPSGTAFLYYTSANGGQTSMYSITNNTTMPVTPTAFPEKCVFDPNSKSIFYCAVSASVLSPGDLDNWYLGLLSFSDDIWKYDTSKNTSTMIEDLNLNAGRSIDAINLQLNSAGSLLIFQSKTDGSLWSLNVTGL